MLGENKLELNFISDNLVEIGAFYGTYVMSPNKKYYLAFDELKKKFILEIFKVKKSIV